MTFGTKGILNPKAGERHFRLDRRLPSPDLAYFILFVGYLFGVRAVVRRRWNVPTKLHHLFVAATLASATVVLVGTPFLFIG